MTKKRSILVTGGTGYIGSHTAVELIEKGYDVVILDNLSNSHAEVIDSIEKITGVRPGFANIDLNNKSAVQEFLRIHPVEAIIHFAAFKAVGESVEKPLEYYRNNLVALINLVELCRDQGIRNFVFSSSCSVYGEPDYLPIDEAAPVKPAQSPYANTKKIGEDILRDASAVLNMNIVSLRYFNPVGAHASHQIGEYPLGTPLNLFPIVMQTAIGKRPGMKVFGQDYNTPDGSCIRDYIHVVDVARAHVVAIRRMLEGKCKNKYELFNLGTGTGLSVLEVIHAFEKSTGIKINYSCVDRRAGDVEKVYADTSYANSELGWKAEHSLEDMIRSAWAWEQELQKKTMVGSK
ncbi:MAG: UDP-glucose 4-epimerase GalE [Bacteroidia bacterium]|nr:UDP-glucose 4-epimerase GalE [Bacteroidia bacterium]